MCCRGPFWGRYTIPRCYNKHLLVVHIKIPFRIVYRVGKTLLSILESIVGILQLLFELLIGAVMDVIGHGSLKSIGEDEGLPRESPNFLCCSMIMGTMGYESK